MDSIEMFLRQAVRTVFQMRAVSLPCPVLTALGVGAATLMFSVLQAVLRPLPVTEAERLIMLWVRDPVAGIPLIEISH